MAKIVVNPDLNTEDLLDEFFTFSTKAFVKNRYAVLFEKMNLICRTLLKKAISKGFAMSIVHRIKSFLWFLHKIRKEIKFVDDIFFSEDALDASTLIMMLLLWCNRVQSNS
jgi:hypothetical protein